MIRVTLDTNVLISGTFWTGDSFKILDLIDKKELKCILNTSVKILRPRNGALVDRHEAIFYLKITL